MSPRPGPGVILVFVDGVGLGSVDLPENPTRDPDLDLLANFHESGWSPPEDGGRPSRLPSVHRRNPLPHDGLAVATDASLGFPGLPQSATGQTTLLTGVNGAEAMGRHYTGFPRITLRKVILAHSLFLQLATAGRTARFANAFGPLFFSLGERVWAKSRMGATSWANKAAELPFLSFEDLQEGRAVFHDITHDTMARGDQRVGDADPLPPRDAKQAGRDLALAAEESDFTLFEFFLTDKAGHAQDAVQATHELVKLEQFLAGILDAVDHETTTVLLTSDHGNIEDLRTGSHTLHPVPTLVFGRNRHVLATQLTTLEAFTPAIMETVTR